MQYDRVELRPSGSENGTYLNLTYPNPTDPYILKNITGLTPPDVDVSIERSLLAGGVYQGKTVQTREIIILLELNPDRSIGQDVNELRESLYSLLGSGGLSLRLLDASSFVVAQISGHIKRFENVPFSKTPEVQITMVCPDVYLEAPSDTELVGSNLSKSVTVINYEGTAPNGFFFEITFTGSRSSWSFTRQGTTEKIEVIHDFVAGDTLRVSTVYGALGVWKRPSGSSVFSQLYYAISDDNSWLQLNRYGNYLVPSGTNWTWDIFKFRKKYWGV